MKEDTDLRACPFCDGEACLMYGDEQWTDVYYIACLRCEAEGPYLPTRAESVIHWNTRVAPTHPRPTRGPWI